MTAICQFDGKEHDWNKDLDFPDNDLIVNMICTKCSAQIKITEGATYDQKQPEASIHRSTRSA